MKTAEEIYGEITKSKYTRWKDKFYELSDVEQLQKELNNLTKTPDFKQMQKCFAEYLKQNHDVELEENYIDRRITEIINNFKGK